MKSLSPLEKTEIAREAIRKGLIPVDHIVDAFFEDKRDAFEAELREKINLPSSLKMEVESIGVDYKGGDLNFYPEVSLYIPISEHYSRDFILYPGYGALRSACHPTVESFILDVVDEVGRDLSQIDDDDVEQDPCWDGILNWIYEMGTKETVKYVRKHVDKRSTNNA